MKNEALYNKTVDILVQAYFDDTLEHANCYACAVGNLVVANMGYAYVECIDGNHRLALKENDGNYFGNTVGADWYDRSKNWAKEACATGYKMHDLMLIEKAFETANRGKTKEDRMFNALMAVIDVLDEIHENKNEEVSNKSKSKFVKEKVVF